jgi:hypothetical protein
MTTKARSTHAPTTRGRRRGCGCSSAARPACSAVPMRPLAATAGHELVMFPKAGRIRFSTFLQVPYSEGRCCGAPRCRTLERDLAR